MSKSMKYLTILAAIAFLPINNVFPQSLLELQSQGWQQVDQILKRIKAPVFKRTRVYGYRIWFNWKFRN
jgi:hypothetical protein